MFTLAERSPPTGTINDGDLFNSVRAAAVVSPRLGLRAAQGAVPARVDRAFPSGRRSVKCGDGQKTCSARAWFLSRCGFTNLHILVERYQEAQKAFHGKLSELTAQHLRDIGLADSEQAGGLYLFEAARF
jgi:hypothetical protein